MYTLGTNLLAPFQQVGATPYFDVAQVTNQVKSSVPVPPSSPVKMNWLSIFSDMMNVASAVATVAGQSDASAVFGLIGSSGNLATDVIQQPGSNGGPANQVTTTAENLAAQMAQQQAAYSQWVDQMQAIVLDDYGKLSGVGTAIGNNSAWTWRASTTSQAITALQANTTASAYSALEPVAWSGYTSPATVSHQMTSTASAARRPLPSRRSTPPCGRRISSWPPRASTAMAARCMRCGHLPP